MALSADIPDQNSDDDDDDDHDDDDVANMMKNPMSNDGDVIGDASDNVNGTGKSNIHQMIPMTKKMIDVE